MILSMSCCWIRRFCDIQHDLRCVHAACSISNFFKSQFAFVSSWSFAYVLLLHVSQSLFNRFKDKAQENINSWDVILSTAVSSHFSIFFWSLVHLLMTCWIAIAMSIMISSFSSANMILVFNSWSRLWSSWLKNKIAVIFMIIKTRKQHSSD